MPSRARATTVLPAALLLLLSTMLAGCTGDGGGDEPDLRTLRLVALPDQARVEVAEAPAGTSSGDLAFRLSHTGGVGLNREPEGRIYDRGGTSGEFHYGDGEAHAFPVVLDLETPLGENPKGTAPLRDFFAFCTDTFVDALDVEVTWSANGTSILSTSIPDPPVCPLQPRVTIGWSEDDDAFTAVEILVPPVVYADRLGLRASDNEAPVHYKIHGRPTAASPTINGGPLDPAGERVDVGDEGTADAADWHVFLCSEAVLEQDVTVEVLDLRDGAVLEHDGHKQSFTYATLRQCP